MIYKSDIKIDRLHPRTCNLAARLFDGQGQRSLDLNLTFQKDYYAGVLDLSGKKAGSGLTTTSGFTYHF